jgi:hypothetical protein
LTFFAPIIPNEARRSQMELSDRLGYAAFVDHIWRERLNERLDALPFRMCRTKSKGRWPHVREADMPLGNVSPIRKART